MARSRPAHPPAAKTGTGGELHQQPGAGGEVLTTNQGVVIADNQNSLKANPRGPTLLEDFILREKITHFDHERIPERIVHARGSGAHGYFELTQSLSQYTKADFLQRVGEKIPVFVRISTVVGGAGSGDLPRDVRGFATKFYTKEGNFDLVGNNIPVFFIQDAIKFPDLIHSVKMEPDRGFPQAASAHDTFWDFASMMPESIHMIMWAMSDRAIPRSLRMIEGFGVHTFRLVDANGNSTFVKFHWRPKLGMQSVLWDEAVKINGADPDFHRRDLWEAIDSGDFPEWEFGVQLFDEKQAASFDFDVLDATKLIPEEIVPLQIVGHMVLDRNPDNFFAETEQIAFCPGNIVPGIDFSNDPLLQGRLFSYIDTQLIRLGGPNFNEIPINQPKCPWANLQRDGHMRMRVGKGRVSYEPNTLAPEAPRADPGHGFSGLTRPESGDTMRIRPESFADHYTQARLFFLSQTRPEQDHIASALVFELSKVETPSIRERVVSHLMHVDETLAKRVAAGLRLEGDDRAGRNQGAGAPRRQAVAGAQHHRQGAGNLERPGDRLSRQRRRRRRAGRRVAPGRRQGRGQAQDRGAPCRRRQDRRREDARGRYADRRRPLGLFRCGGADRVRGRSRRAGARRGGDRLRVGRVQSPENHRPCRRCRTAAAPGRDHRRARRSGHRDARRCRCRRRLYRRREKKPRLGPRAENPQHPLMRDVMAWRGRPAGTRATPAARHARGACRHHAAQLLRSPAPDRVGAALPGARGSTSNA